MRTAGFAGGSCIVSTCSCLGSLSTLLHNPFTAVMQTAFAVQEQEQRISALQAQLQKRADEVASLTLEVRAAQSSVQVRQAPVARFSCDGCEAHGCIISKLLYCTASLYFGYAGH